MALSFKNFKLIESLPVILLFLISLNGVSIVDFNYFSINLHYILVYYWVLKQPRVLGYGFIFLSGLISDVIFGFPLGINALTLLIIASVAAYVRLVTVNVNLLTDWISFIPAIFLANFIYFLSLYFAEYSINYLDFVKDIFFTFIFYPILWIIFSLILNIIKS